jgi:hypothetical protein
MDAILGDGGGSGKVPPRGGPAPGADLRVAAALLAAGLAWCGARAVHRWRERAAAPPPPDPAAILHRVPLDGSGPAGYLLLPGVGPRLAGRMEAERARGGPYSSVEELDRRVPGVGPARVRRWRGRIGDPPEEPR